MHLSYFRKDNQVQLAINEGESPHYELDHTWRKNDSKNNQRNNGPVNAHLISGPGISIKHTKPDEHIPPPTPYNAELDAPPINNADNTDPTGPFDTANAPSPPNTNDSSGLAASSTNSVEKMGLASSDSATFIAPTPRTDESVAHVNTETVPPKRVTNNLSELGTKRSLNSNVIRNSRSESVDLGRRTLAKQRASRSLSRTRPKQAAAAEGTNHKQVKGHGKKGLEMEESRKYKFDHIIRKR